MGSKFKTDYTIIGDPVNFAARLEKLTREVKYSVVFSESLKKSTKEPWSFISLGKYDLKGKKNTHEVYSIDHNIIKEYKENIYFDK